MSFGKSWTFSTVHKNGGTVTALLPPPERSDTYQHARQQAVAVSDGGDPFVQDLCVEFEFLNFRWQHLDQGSWSGLTKLLRAAEWQARTITIDVDGDQAFPVGIAPGQTVGVPLSPGQGWSPGDTVMATAFTLSVRLDQSQHEYEHQQEARGSIALRFRTVTSGV